MRASVDRLTGLAALTPAVTEQLQRARRADAFVRAGRHASAERLLRDVAGALSRRGAREPCATVLLSLGRVLLERGRAEDARRVFEEAAATAREGGAPAVATDAAIWDLTAAIDLAQLDDADARAREVAATAPSSRGHVRWVNSCRARICLWRGQTHDALEHVEASVQDGGADGAVASGPGLRAVGGGAGRGVAEPIVGAWIEGTAVRVLLAAGRTFEAARRAHEMRAGLAGHADPLAIAIAEIARLRVLCASGDLEGGEACLADVVARARAARAPLRGVRARLIWLDALRRAGRSREAERLLHVLRRASRAAPPLLRTAIERASSPAFPVAIGARRHDGLVAAPAPTTRPARPKLLPELIGTSAALEIVRVAVGRAAAAPFAVLIEGESGVGKELLARAIHTLGPRAAGRFCDVNCAALPDELVESELFGHARGAFTGAASDRAGLFEEASGGTLFLDEVAELSLRAQAKLLRVLQQQEVRRLGERASRPIDVRIVCAANRSLESESAAGRFRADLLYRLKVIQLHVPPLRERPEDVAPLVEAFWRAAAARVGTAATLTPGVMSALASYAWPGNVRELQNVVAALAVAAPARGRVAVSLLPRSMTAGVVPLPTLADVRAASERQAVRAALARTAGRRAEAARVLGVTRQGLLKILARLHLEGRDPCGRT